MGGRISLTGKWKKRLALLGAVMMLAVLGGLNVWAAQTAPSEFIHITSCQIENGNQVVIRGSRRAVGLIQRSMIIICICLR